MVHVYECTALPAFLAFSKHMGEITAELVKDALVVLEHTDWTTVHDSAALNHDFRKTVSCQSLLS